MAEPTRVPRDVDAEELVPFALRVVAAWSWRLLLVVAILVGLWQVAVMYSGLVVPVLIAILFTAMLAPIFRCLRKIKFPKPLAALASLLVLLGVVGGILGLVGSQIAGQWESLVMSAQTAFAAAIQWLADSPLKIGSGQTSDIMKDITDWLNKSREVVVNIVTSAGSGLVGFLGGTALALVSTFFFLMDGKRFTTTLTSPLQPKARRSINRAGAEGWKVLGTYVRAFATIAMIDGLTAGIGAVILGSNLFLAIGALEFVLAFIPIIGNFCSMIVASGVIFVTLGPTKALIMVGIFILLMLLEGNVWQPLLLGRAADIHPLMVLLGIALGMTLAGVIGAVFAIPSVAFLIAFFKALNPSSLVEDEIDRMHAEQATSVEVAGPIAVEVSMDDQPESNTRKSLFGRFRPGRHPES